MTRRGRPLATALSVALYLAIIGLFALAALNGARALGYNWQWYRIPAYLFRFTEDGFEWGEIVLGLAATLQLSLLSFALATGIGAAIAALRLSGLVVGSAIVAALLELLRNLPLLVLLYLVYYVLGPIFGLGRYAAAILCLGLFHGALIAEILRAGIQSVPGGQLEAARSLGMSSIQALRYVILPQALRFLLPPMTGEAVHLIKSSAIVSVIAVVEMTTVGRNIIADTYMSFEVWFTIAAGYLVVTATLSLLVSRLEKHYSTGASRWPEYRAPGRLN